MVLVEVVEFVIGPHGRTHVLRDSELKTAISEFRNFVVAYIGMVDVVDDLPLSVHGSGTVAASPVRRDEV